MYYKNVTNIFNLAECDCRLQ